MCKKKKDKKKQKEAFCFLSSQCKLIAKLSFTLLPAFPELIKSEKNCANRIHGKLHKVPSE